MPEFILTERRGSIAIVTLSRPKALNAWHRAMREELMVEIRGFEGDPAVREPLLFLQVQRQEREAEPDPGHAQEVRPVQPDPVADAHPGPGGRGSRGRKGCVRSGSFAAIMRIPTRPSTIR